MAELLTLSIDVIKKIATHGAPELVKYASANGHTTEAVRLAIKRATRGTAETALRGYAQTAVSKTSKEAIKRALREAARKAAEATIKAGTQSAANQMLPRLAQHAVRFGSLVRFYFPQILILTLLAAGLYVLWHQLSDKGSRRSPTANQLTETDQTGADKKQVSSAAIFDNTSQTEMNQPTDKGGVELWSKGWAGSGRRIVAKSHGALVSLSITERDSGLSGSVTYLNRQAQPASARVTVIEISDGFRISYETEAGNVRGDLRIDEESGYLLGTLIMPSQYGGLVDVSLLPRF